MRVLLLSAYDADSHARLRHGLVAALADARCTTVALPPRHYAWRAGGNALALADAVPRERFDVLLAMGPVDLAGLLGLRPELARARRLLYVHEHEFAYPDNPHEQGRVDRQMRQILALLAAERVYANSNWCARSLLEGVATFLARMPDCVPADTVARIEARLAVEPVPLDDGLFAAQRRPRPATGDTLEIVWNHRHEWDKGPDRLPSVLHTLHAAGLPFRLHLLGQRFRTRPAALDEVEAFLASHPQHRGEAGFLAADAYRALLARSDIVLSTALQEFQGLAVMDAVALGCLPCVPDRLAYRDWVPGPFRAASRVDDAGADGVALAELALRLSSAARSDRAPRPPDLAACAWARRAQRWRELLGLDAPRSGAP